MAEVYNPESLRVVAFFRAKRGHASELQEILLSLVEPTQSEPGSISYILHVHESDPHYFMFDEIWLNRKAFEEHLQKPYIQSLSKKIERIIEEPPRIEVYRKVC
ncbi:putative quinol monooxygenase [Nitrososphaera sp.]|uniref:putative quinol monooxygenase n=1 Tax=Nitrososphaera sp. TaxID=1971748 RepID=UPI003173FDE1